MENLILGDCLELLNDVENNSIDLTLTSPPYDGLRDYNNSLVWSDVQWKKVIENLYRVTKNGGTVVWIVNDATVRGSETGTSFRQALFAISCGFNLHDTMIWEKEGFTAVGALKTRYAPVFEYMFVFTKGKIKTFNPIKDRLNKNAGKKLSGTIRQKDGTTKNVSGAGKIYGEFGQRYNVWRINKDQTNTGHPAVFPESLAKDHILSWSNVGDTVLDPFMGSGTTGVVCKKEGRNFIGFEKVREYLEIAKDRIHGA